MTEPADVPDVPLEVLAGIRSVCAALPQASEEPAWVGTRWRIRGRTFAHVLRIDSGWPPAYARAASSDGPITVMTFRSSGGELEALKHAGYPFFKPRWHADIVGIVLDAGTDWQEVAELITESYRMARAGRGSTSERPVSHQSLSRRYADCPGRAFAGAGLPLSRSYSETARSEPLTAAPAAD